MSALLPLFVSPPQVASATGGKGGSTGPIGNIGQGPSKSFNQTFAGALSHTLRDQNQRPEYLDQLHALIAARRSQNGPLPNAVVDPVVSRLQGLLDPASLGSFIKNLQTDPDQELPQEVLSLLEGNQIASLVPSFVTTGSVVTPSTGSNPDSGISNEPFPITGNRLPVSPVSGQGIQPTANGGLYGQDGSQPGGNSIVGNGQPHLHPAGRSVTGIGNSVANLVEPGHGANQGSLANRIESSIPPPTSQGAVGKHTALGETPGENVLVASSRHTRKDGPQGIQQFGRPGIESETSGNEPLLRADTPRTRPVQPLQQFPATALPAGGPAGFSGPGQANPFAVKTSLGQSNIFGEGAGLGYEHQTTVTAEGLGETGLLSKGDRASTISDHSDKGLVIDARNGQGLGSGMNHFSNSQSGFQQSGLQNGHGVGLRAMDERGVEFPAQALQRLQMDVQLSDNQRVMIDVGVQNKQVYAGLVMDQAILRNLANQFVPQLETQLSQVDLELQEFSAEVREDAPQGSDRWGDDVRSGEGDQFTRLAHDGSIPTTHEFNQQQETGLHLLA